MASTLPRRALEDAPARVPSDLLGAFRQRVVDVLLWTLGVLGLLSLIGAIAAHVWGFSIILFSTGSMSPTIPAGSAALVRLVPAGDLAVGDITTIERPGQLPITHRITSIEQLSGSPSVRVVTMRGDANAVDDPEPYVITDARVVMAAAPGVAQFFSGLRDPRLMAALTVLAGILVTWAFWPRQRRKAAALAAVAVVASTQLMAAPDAEAAESDRIVKGEHLVLTVVSDESEMASMVPGTPVLWQVGVATKGKEEGAIHIGLGLAADSVDANALTVDVLACPERWQGLICPGDAEAWVVDAALDQAFLPSTHGDTREFASTDAGVPVWVQVRATLDHEDPALKATLKIAAWGGGEMVSAETDNGGSGSSHGLAYTGIGGIPETLAVAGAAIGAGLVVARLAGRRRRDTDREVAR